jgi:outer membrane protein assembly factor BamB
MRMKKPKQFGKLAADIDKIGRHKKTLLSIIALVVLLASSVFAVLPIADAHTPAWTVPTYAFLNVAPNPVGVNQQLNINMWLNFAPITANAQYGDRWQNFKVNVTLPDGTLQTLGPFASDAVGAKWVSYTPTQIGTYTFVFWFPGQTIEGANPAPSGSSNAAYVGDYYQPSVSRIVTVTVQQQPVEAFPSNPLPTDYWQRPIYSTNGEWYQISGNWLGLKGQFGGASGQYNATSNFNPYTTAPTTAHIIWTKPLAAGGLMGGEFGGSEQANFYATSQYENKFCPIIMNGVLYFTDYPGASTNPAGWFAVDLKTGETLWTKDTTANLICGQILNYVSPNQFGGIPYLWAGTGGMMGAGTFMMFDAFSGNWILNVTDPHQGGFVGSATATDENGNLLCYYLNSTNAIPGNPYSPAIATSLSMWNSTLAIMTYSLQFPSGGMSNAWTWRPPQGAQIPWDLGVQWSVPVPLTMTQPGGTQAAISPALGISGGVSQIANGVVLLNNIGNGAWQPGWTAEAGYSASDGTLLWIKNQTQSVWTSILPGAAGDGVYTEFTRETMTWSGYSITTGQKVWGPTEPSTDPWSYYDWWSSIYAYGNLYAWTYGGHVYCYDISTGELLWQWNTGPSGYETPYGTWPLWVFNNGVVADGKIYIEGGHEYNPPLFKGAKVYCLNATTGEEIFETLGFDVSTPPAISDGTMLVHNSYDNQIYAYDKGRSGTTVSAPQNIQPLGTSVLIQGAVTDQSPGQTCLGIPAAGTPAIADEDMSAWMEYLYMQQPKPTDATGVPVHITAVDPNGNWQDIGTVTSDIDGNFAVMWTPPVPGLYKITATFVGSESYYSSHAVTNLGVSETPIASPIVVPTTAPTVAPTTAPTAAPTVSPSVVPEPEAAPSTDIYVIAAAAVIVVVVAVAAVFLRKRK